jgi:DNA-binding transcriptional MocR family regulator
MKLNTRRHISDLLRDHQKRLQMGDNLPSISELADRAGLHRDTLYQAIAGQRISQASQVRLERMLQRLSEEAQPPSRLMHVKIGHHGVSLGFGIGVRGFK